MMLKRKRYQQVAAYRVDTNEVLDALKLMKGERAKQTSAPSPFSEEDGSVRQRQEAAKKRVEKLLADVFLITSNVRGTDAYKNAFRKQMEALQIPFGPPNFFVTINPADLHSPILINFAGKDINLDDVWPRGDAARG